MKKIIFILVVVLFNYFLCASFTFAESYKVRGVGTGSISGIVSFDGSPKDVKIDLTEGENDESCLNYLSVKGVKKPKHNIGFRPGRLKGAVVFIENISKGDNWNLPNTQTVLKKCNINTITIRKENSITSKKHITKNADVLHNPHGYRTDGANRKTLFNKPLPSVGASADVTKNLKRLKKKKSKHFFLQCDQHGFMEADSKIVWNPYYQVTGNDGTFKLDGVPQGQYKVVAWHPYMGNITGEFNVSEGQESKGDFKFKGPGDINIFENRGYPSAPRGSQGGKRGSNKNKDLNPKDFWSNILIANECDSICNIYRKKPFEVDCNKKK
jgi:hypothetical protein